MKWKIELFIWNENEKKKHIYFPGKIMAYEKCEIGMILGHL